MNGGELQEKVVFFDEGKSNLEVLEESHSYWRDMRKKERLFSK